MAGEFSPAVLLQHVLQLVLSQQHQGRNTAFPAAGAAELDRLAGFRILERAGVQIRKHIGQQIAEVVSATGKTSAEVFNFPTTLVQQFHKGGFFGRLGQDLHEQTTTAVQA